MNEVAKRNLPTINELYSTDLAVLDKKNQLNILLNQPPKESWIKDNPVAAGARYLPIERVEWLLTNIFIEWHVEILSTQLLANSVVVTVRLYYRDPITGEEHHQDGIGAVPLQTKQGAASTDWTQMKADAVMKAAPSAESFAIKDAAEKLGKLFGKDLNRKEEIAYDTLRGKFDDPEVVTLKKNLIKILDGVEPKTKEKTIRYIQDLEAKGQLTVDILNNLINSMGVK